MLFLGLVLGIIILAVLWAIPKTNAILAAHKSVTGLVVLAYLAAVILQPYIFGLRGRIAEHLFERHIRIGMSRDEVIRWADTFGWDKGAINAVSEMHEPYSSFSDGRLDITFIDAATFCVSGGRDYEFYFSPDWKLREWRIEPWASAC